MEKTILVIGACGLLGRSVAQKLLLNGFKVRVFDKDVFGLRKIFDKKCDLSFGDVTVKSSLKYVFEDCYAVYVNLLNDINESANTGSEYNGIKNILETALANNVQCVSLHSKIYINPVNAHVNGIDTQLKTENFLEQSGVAYTIFKTTSFMDTIPFFIRKNKVLITGEQKTTHSWLALDDYTNLVAEDFRDENKINKKIIVRGPEKFTIEEAIKIFIEKVIPDVKIKKISGLKEIVLEKLSKDNMLLENLRKMKYFKMFDRTIEPIPQGDSNYEIKITGTTLNEWVDKYITGIKQNGKENK